ncbi:glycosyltransferase family 2 protein [Tenacibaculum sp. Mcav3-52]|uniref:glycosyltransferase family 2 protein n=1 Tax=Tenacibaculum TaxID=104267 RepID=UPI0012E68DE6|nr:MULTISPECIES: glycosyltransferase family 2 protein [unclassified Tenacibaculum]BFF36677.1 glycosyltransferase family 2 protein [Tenacibaculum mesophilum]GFD73497.1 glycosyl transferase [Tenacibaculum sp. KUL113]GFD83391.1 glycosyl transferase [Tenacibaculum sp. KUL118]MCG7502540.1 glycosyltransferase family 2 protein [Tenacibaculum sp. Mcav3-52]MCO7186324.1 glycosyltransferase family 2 protein [Tenacibaculum sp. XPcli2-G]
MSNKKSYGFISVIVPVYNEEDNVVPLTKQIDDSLKGFDYEIIYIDDFSTDNTKKNVVNMNNPRVVLVELRKNYGQSLALAAGFDQAKGDYIVTLDGDMQNDPSDIPHMIEKAESEDWDVVTGIRAKRKDSFIRTIPSKIANFLIRRATRLDLKDQGCAIKVFKKEIAKDLNLYGEMHRFINLLAHLNGAKITQVPVKHHPRIHGQSKYGLGRTVKVINDIILIIFQRKYMQRPVHLFGNFGLFFMFFGLAINFYLLVLKLLGQDIWGRPLLIVGVMLVIISLQFFTVGIITDLLMRTYYESQKKRPYTIRKIHVSE